jgi:ribosomal protein L3 glutamine methyltransferase
MDALQQPEQQLITVRDWLRYAVSRFNAAQLAYGHGTSNARDEAAFLILHTLKLPIDQLDPWLDARLLMDERTALRTIIEKRISTRKPAPYLTNEAWAGGHSFYVDERVIVPRSYIAELMAQGLSDILPETADATRILDLCTGSGCLAILAALAFPDAAVDAAELSPDALKVAERNVADYGLEDRVRLVRSDLFAGLGKTRYDLIISNPPYVTAESLAAFPPEYAAEPAMAHAGGEDGMDIVRRILAGASARLTEDGTLLMEVGMGRAVLDTVYPDLPYLWLDTEESEGEVFALRAADLAGLQT